MKTLAGISFFFLPVPGFEIVGKVGIKKKSAKKRVGAGERPFSLDPARPILRSLSNFRAVPTI